jgi:hypothetical protein
MGDREIYIHCEKHNAEQLRSDIKYLNNIIKIKQQKIDKAIEYMHNFDIFDKFSFPLMKKCEEQQVKSSIEYEFNNSLYKDLLEILKGKSE